MKPMKPMLSGKLGDLAPPKMAQPNKDITRTKVGFPHSNLGKYLHPSKKKGC